MPPLCTHIQPTERLPGEVRTGIAGGPGWVRGSRCPRRESIRAHRHLSGRSRARRGWGRIHVEDNLSHAAGRREARDHGHRLVWLASSGRCPPLAPTERCAPRACALPADARGWSRRLRNAQTFPQFPKCFRRLTVQEIPIIPEIPSALAAGAPVKTRHSFPKLPLFTLKPIPIIPEMPSASGARAPVKTRQSFPKLPLSTLKPIPIIPEMPSASGADAPAEKRAFLPETRPSPAQISPLPL
jgi:hypothetical protein